MRELEMRIMNVFMLCPQIEQSTEQLASHWFAGENAAAVRAAVEQLSEKGMVESCYESSSPVYRLRRSG